MRQQVAFRYEARTDVDEAFTWYESQQPGLGAEFVEAVDDAIEGVIEHHSLTRSFKRTFAARSFSVSHTESSIRSTRAQSSFWPYSIRSVIQKYGRNAAKACCASVAHP